MSCLIACLYYIGEHADFAHQKPEVILRRLYLLVTLNLLLKIGAGPHMQHDVEATTVRCGRFMHCKTLIRC